jgi:hypothetical protein
MKKRKSEKQLNKRLFYHFHFFGEKRSLSINGQNKHHKIVKKPFTRFHKGENGVNSVQKQADGLPHSGGR